MKDNMTNRNTVWHAPTVSRQDREMLNGHKTCILWFTGLSGSGKSTLAHSVEERLYKMGVRTYVLDGDNVRHGLCKDLGFSDADRTENIRRIGEVSKLLMEAGVITLSAFISPFVRDRRLVRELVPEGMFVEIYCNAPLEICEQRDVKGLYKKARAGLITDFTGIGSPYEKPDNPEISLDTAHSKVSECVDSILAYLRSSGILPAS